MIQLARHAFRSLSVIALTVYVWFLAHHDTLAAFIVLGPAMLACAILFPFLRS